MKRHRKQGVFVNGVKQLVDVPVDTELYKADNREEYQRVRSKLKHVSLDVIVHISASFDVAEDYEKRQLLDCLREAVQALKDDERQLIEHIFFDGLTERETASIFKISQQAVAKRKQKIIKKLQKRLVNWL